MLVSIDAQQVLQIKALSAVIPINGYGLPEGIYRPDLLPSFPQISSKSTPIEISLEEIPHEDPETPNPSTALTTVAATAPFNAEVSALSMGKYGEVAKQLGIDSSLLVPLEDEIDASFIALDFTEGFPTLSGIPFWSQLPYESNEAFSNFTSYLQQPSKNGGIRQLYTLETPSKSSLDRLQEQSVLNYWSFRAKAYDTFNILFRRKERERLAVETENEHFLLANRLMNLCALYLDANEQELQENLSPKNFLELLKTATQLQRISVGLPGAGPTATSSTANGEGTSLEVILRSLAAANTLPKNVSAEAGTTGKSAQDQLNNMRSMLHNPEVLNLAQELIVRFNTPQGQ